MYATKNRTAVGIGLALIVASVGLVASAKTSWLITTTQAGPNSVRVQLSDMDGQSEMGVHLTFEGGEISDSRRGDGTSGALWAHTFATHFPACGEVNYVIRDGDGNKYDEGRHN